MREIDFDSFVLFPEGSFTENCPPLATVNKSPEIKGRKRVKSSDESFSASQPSLTYSKDPMSSQNAPIASQKLGRNGFRVQGAESQGSSSEKLQSSSGFFSPATSTAKSKKTLACDEKRLRNREHARKSRERKKEMQLLLQKENSRLQEQITDLGKENTSLKARIEALERQNSIAAGQGMSKAEACSPW